MKNRTFLRLAALTSLGSGLIGFALKFTIYFDEWYFLPMWPNLGDSMFIAAAGLAIIYLAVREAIRDLEDHK